MWGLLQEVFLDRESADASLCAGSGAGILCGIWAGAEYCGLLSPFCWLIGAVVLRWYLPAVNVLYPEFSVKKKILFALVVACSRWMMTLFVSGFSCGVALRSAACAAVNDVYRIFHAGVVYSVEGEESDEAGELL